MAMGLSAGTAFITILPDMSKFSNALGSKMRRAGMAAMTVGRQLTHFITLPLLAAAAASVKMGVDFQASMEQIHTQAGASQREVNKLSKAVLDLAPSVATGPNELAAGLYHIESVGYRGAKAMSILKVSALNAKVGMANLEDTASALSAVLVTNIKGTENYSHATGILNGIIGSGNMHMQDLVSALKSGVVPTAKIAGLSLRGLGAAIAMLTDEGVPATTAAMRLRTTLFMLTNPTAKALKVLKSLGLTAKSMGHDMQKPDGLNVAMQDLKKHMAGIKDPTQRLADLGAMFGGSRTAGTVAMLLNNLGRIKLKYDQIGKTAGKYASLVDATKHTAKFKLDKAWASIQVDLIKVGMKLVPVVVELANKLSELAGWFTKLSPSMQKDIGIALLVLAALGPLAIVIGSILTVGGALISTLGFIGGAFVTLAGIIPGVTVAVTEADGATIAFGATMDAMTVGSLPLLGAAIAAIAVVGIVSYFATVGGQMDIFTESNKEAKAATQDLGTALHDLATGHLDLRQAILQRKQASDQLTHDERAQAAFIAKNGHASHAISMQVQQDQIDVQRGRVQVASAHSEIAAATTKEKKAWQKLGDSAKKAGDEAWQAAARATRRLPPYTTAVMRAAHAADINRRAAALLAAGQDKLVAKLMSSAGSLHGAKLKAAEYHQAVSDLTTAIGKVPTTAQINLYFKNHLDQLKNQVDQLHTSLTNLPSSKQIDVSILRHTTGGYVKPPHKAAGGPVSAGQDYLVGEVGPELFVPRTSGTIVPNHALQAGVMGRSGSGAMRLVIDNWQEGTGYITSIADDSVNAAGRLTRQKDRMSR